MSTPDLVENGSLPRQAQEYKSPPGDKILMRLTNFFGVLGGIGIVMLMLHVVLDVSLRFLLNKPIQGTLEFSQFWYMPIIVFLGLAIAERTDQHISAPIVYDRLSPRLKIELTIVSTVLSVALLIGFAWYGYQEALTHLQQRSAGIVSEVPIWPARFLVPIGCVMFALELC